MGSHTTIESFFGCRRSLARRPRVDVHIHRPSSLQSGRHVQCSAAFLDRVRFATRPPRGAWVRRSNHNQEPPATHEAVRVLFRYAFVGALFAEVAQAFPDAVLNIGGDEVSENHPATRARQPASTSVCPWRCAGVANVDSKVVFLRHRLLMKDWRPPPLSLLLGPTKPSACGVCAVYELQLPPCSLRVSIGAGVSHHTGTFGPLACRSARTATRRIQTLLRTYSRSPC